MILRIFETNKNEIYGNNEKLLMTRPCDFFPPKGSLVMFNEESYRVADLCFESMDDFNGQDTVCVMLVPEE